MDILYEEFISPYALAEAILDKGFVSVIAEDGVSSLRPKTGTEHLDALEKAGLRITRATLHNPNVFAEEWTCDIAPFTSAEMSCREAAIEILKAIDWSRLVEEYVRGERSSVHPALNELEIAGLTEHLDWSFGRLYLARAESHLIAWATSRMSAWAYCANMAHAYDDEMTFNYCDGESEDGPCEWKECWALLGDPTDFLDLAITLFKERR